MNFTHSRIVLMILCSEGRIRFDILEAKRAGKIVSEAVRLCHAYTTPALPTGTSLLAKPDHPPLLVFLGSHNQSVRVDTWTKAICCTCGKRPVCQGVRRSQRLLSREWLRRVRAPGPWAGVSRGLARCGPFCWSSVWIPLLPEGSPPLLPGTAVTCHG